jgi:fusion protein PurCD
MKVLLIANGGREHAIADACRRSAKCSSLICYGSKTNPGIKKLTDQYELGNLLDFEHLESFARAEKPNLAIVGPEDPIALGAADKLEAMGIPTVAPKQLLARLESSKSFTRNLLIDYNLGFACPAYKIVTELQQARDFIENLGTDFVIKMDGLCGGKGVKVMGDHFQTITEGLNLIKDGLAGQHKIVVEEKLIGQEFSLMSFVDGKTVFDMPAVQDHKRAFVDDKGPNTGGMGSYSYPDLLPFLTAKDLTDAHQITEKVMFALEEECGETYRGIMYGGFIATKNGIKLIEYNARFGDPECLNVLPVLESDFLEICNGIINQTLHQTKVKFQKKATVCKYLVPQGYPDHPIKDAKITIGQIPEDVKLYYAAIDEKDGDLYLSGSRAIAMVGIADQIEEAEQKVETAIKMVTGPIFHRPDIGTTKLINKRVKMMRELRG